MDGEKLNALLPKDSLFAGKVTVLDRTDSTNTRLKELAEDGAPEGTVLVAGEQTAGRGTAGREFFSPRGEGLYLSVLLRPNAAAADLFTLTGWAAVAVRDGVERACGAPCRIKWLNDIYLNGRKLCGILTELSPLRGDRADYIVAGLGVNVSQTAETFADRGLGSIATSLAAEGYAVGLEALAASILGELETMYRRFPQDREEYLKRYRAHCLTVGRRVSCQAAGAAREGFAAAVDDDFALVVEDAWGRRTVSSGTVYLK